MSVLLNLLHVMLGISYPLALAAGFVVCWKRSFKPGLSFFAILLIREGWTLVVRFHARQFSEHAAAVPGNFTVGEWFAVLRLIDQMLLVSAFVVLVLGFYRHRKRQAFPQ